MRLVYIALGWAAGIVLAADAITLSPLIWAGLAVWMALIAAATWRDPPYRLFNLVVLAFVLGGLRVALTPTTSEVAAYNNTGGLTIEGVIVAEPDRRDTRTDLRLRARQIMRGGEIIPTDGLVLVRAPRSLDVAYGDVIQATGQLITPAEFDTFSYADYLGREGVYSIMSTALISVIDRQQHGSPLAHTLINLRHRAADTIASHLPEPQAGLLAGMILGDRRGISPELIDDFSKVGASHLIAISGFNMAILAGVIAAALNRLPLSRWLAALIGISLLLSYALFVGAAPGVLRAAIMSSMLVIAPLLRRKTYVPASLAFVALLMTLHDPLVLWDVSFQLSFFATLGLALFVEPLSRGFRDALARYMSRPRADRIGYILEGPLIVTLAAQITTLPLSLLYFERLPLVFLPANLLLIPIHPVQLILGGLATVTSFAIPALGQILYWLEFIVLSWTIGVVRIFAAPSFAAVDFQIDPQAVTVYFGGMFAWAILRATRPDWWLRLSRLLRRQATLVAVSIGALVLLALMAGIALSRPDGRLHVWFLDVGHNNAVLVQTPGGAHVLIDGGRFPSRLLTAIGDRLPFHDREIEVVIITRPNEFATSALTAVLARYDTGVVLSNGQPNLSPEYQALQEALAGHDALTVRAGYSLALSDGTLIEVLHPQVEPELGQPMDDHALTVRVTYREVSFLLAGNLSAEGQRQLLAAGEWPAASVLQLPQHGGARSLDVDFLAAVGPQVAVVQSDPANRRGDPDPLTLALLPDDVRLFRTDESGALHLWTDGDRLWVNASGR
jgi:competence protein ComEC